MLRSYICTYGTVGNDDQFGEKYQERFIPNGYLSFSSINLNHEWNKVHFVADSKAFKMNRNLNLDIG